MFTSAGGLIKLLVVSDEWDIMDRGREKGCHDRMLYPIMSLFNDFL